MPLQEAHIEKTIGRGRRSTAGKKIIEAGSRRSDVGKVIFTPAGTSPAGIAVLEMLQVISVGDRDSYRVDRG